MQRRDFDARSAVVDRELRVKQVVAIRSEAAQPAATLRYVRGAGCNANRNAPLRAGAGCIGNDMVSASFEAEIADLVSRASVRELQLQKEVKELKEALAD